MNFDRIYKYRFKGIDPARKRVVWEEISRFISKMTGSPGIILDPAAGQCEFINAVSAKEKWAVDINEGVIRKHAAPEVVVKVGDARTIDLPIDYFDLVFISNFLEHLHSQEEVADFLQSMYRRLKRGGLIVVMGPNFKYCYRQYFDFADHSVVLSDLGLAEHLYGAGFEITRLYPRFLPLSFRGSLPANRLLVRLYVKLPILWPILGKQFLAIAKK